jgi:orotidine-5'-phosphate decarboxylase|tara:strand:- start:11772 stop:12479 length:708 start_codon:yes stop_codon:yes gene_type:complete
MKTNNPRIIVALDYSNSINALEFVETIDPTLCKLKVGKELFTRCGPSFVSLLVKKGFDVFLDLKFHDIPSTVSKAIKAASDLGVWMTNLHASGGREMMEEAKNTLDKSGSGMLLIAVTVLTSFNSKDLNEIGVLHDVNKQVNELAWLSKKSGMDGVVASAMEAEMLRKTHGDEFIIVTPGIRLNSVKNDDQNRIVSPSQAIINGSNYLVIGRPVTRASNPSDILKRISHEISKNL